MYNTNFETRNQLDVLVKCNDRELACIYKEIVDNMNDNLPVLTDGDYGYELYKEIKGICTLDDFISSLHKEMARRFANEHKIGV